MNLFNKIFKKPKAYKLKPEIINEVSSRTEWRTPTNYGWLNCKLNQKELDYVWECVNNKKIMLIKLLLVIYLIVMH